MMNKKPKACPFFQKYCLKSQCDLYSETLDNCAIGLLSYNIYRLTKEMARLTEGSIPFGKDEGIPFLGSNPKKNSIADIPG
jgi:hypothetical protein